MMEGLDPETMFKLLAELAKLNDNLRATRETTMSLVSNLKDLKDGTKSMMHVAKQVNILNQILLSVKKTSGAAGVVQHFLDAILKAGLKQ